MIKQNSCNPNKMATENVMKELYVGGYVIVEHPM